MTPNSKMEPGSEKSQRVRRSFLSRHFQKSLIFAIFFQPQTKNVNNFAEASISFASTGSSPESHCLYVFPDRVQPLSVILKVDRVITSRRAFLSNRKGLNWKILNERHFNRGIRYVLQGSSVVCSTIVCYIDRAGFGGILLVFIKAIVLICNAVVLI